MLLKKKSETLPPLSPQQKQRITSIQVLGAGCQSCHMLYENMKKAAGALGLECPVEYITDPVRIADTGVMRMPAVLINGKAALAGKVITPPLCEKLLRQYIQ